jgi:hypothetical protein
VPAWARRQVVFRGFPAAVQCTVRDFLKGAAGLFKRAPVQRIHFRTFKERMKELAASPRLARLTTLDLSDNRISDAGALALADSRHLANLKDLDLLDNTFSKATVKRLKERFGEGVFAFARGR